MGKLPIIPGRLFHAMDTADLAHPITEEAIIEINHGYVAGREARRQARQPLPFGVLEAVIEEEQLLGGQSPEHFIGYSMGLRKGVLVLAGQLDAVRLRLAAGVHAAETKVAERRPAGTLDEEAEAPAASETFFALMQTEVERIREDRMIGTRPNSLEGFIGFSIGARTYLRAEEAKVTRRAA